MRRKCTIFCFTTLFVPTLSHSGGIELDIDGRLDLMTPEGVRLALVPAGPGLRALAYLVDFLIWAVVVVVAMIPLAAEATTGLRFLFLFATWWGYPVLFEVLHRGQTPGKTWMKIQVVRADGLPVGWRESILRNLLLTADFLPMAYLTGLLCLLLDPRFRRIGDWVAGTQVVHCEIAVVIPVVGKVEAERAPFPFDVQEQRTLLELAERAPRLGQERAAELADIAAPLTGEKGDASLKRLLAWSRGVLE